MDASLTLRYSGPAVDSGLMNVYDASANMIAFSEFMVAAAKATYGDQVDARAEVAGFGRGSFVTDLFFTFVGPAASIFTAFTPDQLLAVVTEAFKLWKHLGGEKPRAVERANHQHVSVTNNNGQVIQVQAETLNLVFGDKAAEAVERFVRTPLSGVGIDSVSIATSAKDGSRVVAEADQSDADAFRHVAPSEAITDTTIRMTLVIEAPVFRDGNKWRFSDGQNSFYADIQDKEFLARVDHGERFGKGDLLTVDLQIRQERSGLKISAERTVVAVHEHKGGQVQGSLLG